MRGIRRSVALVGVVLACGFVVMPTVLATTTSARSPSAQTPSQLESLRTQKFVGLTEVPAPGRLRHGALGTHTVTVVPLFFRTPPAHDVFDVMAREVSSFYAREVPGVRVSFRYGAARKVTKTVACTPQRAMDFVRLHSAVDPTRSHIHLLAWVPECASGGYGWIGSGQGMMWIGGASPQLLAHEFGHNLGLPHSYGLNCLDSSGHQMTLSTNCTESLYDDPFSVMGNQCDIASSCQLVGADIAALTGQVVAVSPHVSRVVTLVTSGRSGARTAYMRTPIGVIYFDAAPASASAYAGLSPPGVQMRILTRPGNALLRIPNSDADATVSLAPALQAFDTWTIPGVDTRIVVESATNSSAVLHFMPTLVARGEPSTPTITSARKSLYNEPYLLRWIASESGTPLLGYAVRRVENGVTTTYRVPADHTSVRLPGVISSSGANIKVWAVNRAGVRSMPAAIRVTTDPDFIRFSMNGQSLSRKKKADQLSPTLTAQVGNRGLLRWDVDADQAVRITGWHLYVQLHDGSTFDVALPAAARHWVLNRAVMNSVGETRRFAAPFVLISVIPRGIAYDAEVTLQPTRAH